LAVKLYDCTINTVHSVCVELQASLVKTKILENILNRLLEVLNT